MFTIDIYSSDKIISYVFCPLHEICRCLWSDFTNRALPRAANVNSSQRKSTSCTRANELRERTSVPYDNFLNLFKVRARAAKVIFVCCFRDPRGLLSRERDMFRRQTFEV